MLKTTDGTAQVIPLTIHTRHKTKKKKYNPTQIDCFSKRDHFQSGITGIVLFYIYLFIFFT